MSEAGRLLVLLGAILAMAGGALMLAGRFHLPLGHLPGDFTYRGKSVTVFVPITTCILLSLLLGLIFYAIGRIPR